MESTKFWKKNIKKLLMLAQKTLIGAGDNMFWAKGIHFVLAGCLPETMETEVFMTL